MSQISLKSITGITSITTPSSGVDNQLTVHTNDTTERIKITSSGLNVSGVVTATSFVGSGAALTGIDATAIKDTSGNVKIQAQASGAIHSGVSTFTNIQIDNSSGSGISFLNDESKIQTGSSGHMLGIQGGATNMGGRIELRGGNDTGDIRMFAQGATSTQVERLRINSSGQLLSGVTGNAGAADANVVFGGGGAAGTNNYGKIYITQSQSNPSANTAIGFIGFSNQNLNNVPFAFMGVYADADHGTNDYPSRFSFHTTPDGSSTSSERLRIDSSGHMSLGHAGSPASSNGNVTKKFGIRSTQNNVIVGETSATSENTGFIFEARQTGRSGNARIAQINMGNDAGADGRIKFHTAPDNADVQERFRISNNGIRAYTTLVDTSYHANPDPLGDGSGIAYYRLNYNFQDSGRFGNHGQGIQGGDPTFALVNSSGEPCWQNPADGAINLPNLKNSYPFSMAAWINVSSWPTTGDNDLIMNLSIGGQRVSLCICCWGSVPQDGADFYIMYGSAGHYYFRPSSKPTNEWIHVVYSVVASDNTSHRVYQNGAELTTIGNRGGGHGGSAGWAMGGNAANSERFSIGRIGSIRFFNKAISSSEASALYTNDKFYT